MEETRISRIGVFLHIFLLKDWSQDAKKWDQFWDQFIPLKALKIRLFPQAGAAFSKQKNT